MSAKDMLSFWQVKVPDTWPSAPPEMSVSTLLAIEACPRRWALSSADYSHLWSGVGYPPKPHFGAFYGNVLHLAIETITNALVVGNCPSVQDVASIQIMRSLGGYTAVLERCLEGLLTELMKNPRAEWCREHLKQSLLSKIPDLRERVQAMLPVIELGGAGQRRGEKTGTGPRRPLSLGTYTEVQLKATSIAWTGRVDLLRLTDNLCEIIEFKSGERNEFHSFQVRAYGLLWALDSQLNPTKRLATCLKVVYRDGDLLVPPLTAEEIEGLKAEVVSRSKEAVTSVSTNPPRAIPSKQNCPFCSVRHMCDPYWQDLASWSNAGVSSGEDFENIELEVCGWHGPLSIDCLVKHSRFDSDGKRAILRFDRTRSDFSPSKGQLLRVLDAHVAYSNDDELYVVTMGAYSEVFDINIEKSTG